MSLAKKLNLREGMEMQIVGRPRDVDLGDMPTTDSPGAGAVLAFAATLADVDTRCERAVEVARADGLAWIAYPKAGRLGTDINRDVLARHLAGRGVRCVRQVSIDEIWSAMRFRPLS